MDDQRRVALVETKTQDVANPLASPTPELRFQLDNHLGSAVLEVDDTGQVITYEEYFPFGGTSFHATRLSAARAAKRYRYVGRERDEETDLCYHGARY